MAKKPKSRARLHFGIKKGPTGKDIGVCVYCKWETVLNATRQTDHLIYKCDKIPKTIKEKFKADESAALKKRKKGPGQASSSTSPAKKRALLPNDDTSDRESDTSSSSASDCPTTATTPSNPGTSTQYPTMPSKPSFVDSISEHEQEKLRSLFAKAVYASGIPFATFENPAWKSFFSRLRPTFKVPNRHDLDGKLLDEVYDDLKLIMEKKISEADSLAISIDGWTNIRKESIMNILLFTPEPIFLKSVECKSESHTGEYIAKQLEEVILEKGKEKFIGIPTDNASNMKNAGQRVELQFDWLTWYGCLMHFFNLLLTDLCTLVQRIKEVLALCIAITKEILRTPSLLSIFREKQIEEKQKGDRAISLKIPGATRFGSSTRCMYAVSINKGALQALAIDNRLTVKVGKKINYLMSPDFKREILSDEFWSKISDVTNILRPIEEWLFEVQSNSIPLSRVVIALKDITNKVNSALETSSYLDEDDVGSVQAIITKRKSQCLQPIHFAATLLDPSTHNSSTPDDTAIALDYLGRVGAALELDCAKILEEYADFSLQKGVFAPAHLWKKLKVEPHVWWKSFLGHTELSKIASRILCLPPTSAEVERSFSTHGRIHGKVRNRLLNSRAEKLVYIHMNLKLLEDKPKRKKKKGSNENVEGYCDNSINPTSTDFEYFESESNEDLSIFLSRLETSSEPIIVVVEEENRKSYT